LWQRTQFSDQLFAPRWKSPDWCGSANNVVGDIAANAMINKAVHAFIALY